MSHTAPGSTWAKKSLAILDCWGILDSPKWPGDSADGYKGYVKAVVIAKCNYEWNDAISSHVLPVPYLTCRPRVSTDLRLGLDLELSWCSLRLQRSFSRLRAGLLCFSHSHGNHTTARRSMCIFCNEVCLSINFYVLCRCSRWDHLISIVWSYVASPRPVSLESQVTIILRSGPGDAAYCAVLALAGSLDQETARFWGGT